MSQDRGIDHWMKLVPVYVNGSMNDIERGEFRRALRSSAALRAEVAQEQELQKRFNAAMEARLHKGKRKD